MFGLSFTHLLVLLVLALIFIGPEQLPEVARTIGRLLNEFKRSTSVLAEDMKAATREENIRKMSAEIEAHKSAQLVENQKTKPDDQSAVVAKEAHEPNKG